MLLSPKEWSPIKINEPLGQRCVLLPFLDQEALFNNFMTKSEMFQGLLGPCYFWRDSWRKEENVYSLSFYIHYTINEVATGHPDRDIGYW